MTAPKAFMSYSHDTPEHRQWVLDLANRLMKDGIDVTLDLWGLKPGVDLPHFMESNLAAADYVLMVCTDNYVAKANGGKGGVGYEKMIVTADLMTDIQHSKVIPLIRQAGTTNRPTFLRTKMYVNLSGENIEFGYDELLRTLHNAPVFVKPKVGERPSFETASQSTAPVEKTGDPVLIIMKIAIDFLEKNIHKSAIPYPHLVEKAQLVGFSRLYVDGVLQQIKAKNLMFTVSGAYMLSEPGRAYAAKHNLA